MDNNLLTDKERDRLAIDFVGWIKQKQSTIGEEMCYWQKLGGLGPSHRCQVTNWLSGNLTSPESYYQVHHILLPKVREKYLVQITMSSFVSVEIYKDDGTIKLMRTGENANETIIRALLDVMEGE